MSRRHLSLVPSAATPLAAVPHPDADPPVGADDLAPSGRGTSQGAVAGARPWSAAPRHLSPVEDRDGRRWRPWTPPDDDPAA